MNAKRFFLFFTLLIFLACGSSDDSSDTSGNNGNNNGGNNNGGNTGGNDDTKDETNYYFSDSGNDSNSGSQKNPWKSLSKLNSSELNPGDSIFFNRGDSFFGELVVNGSGTASEPIVFTSYGSGDKPIISGKVGSSGGGDYQQAIYVLNNDNMVFENLEVQNNRQAPRTNVDNSDSFGIHIHLSLIHI